MKRLPRMVLSLGAKLWLVFAAVLVLAAIALTAVRVWLPVAVGATGDVETLISDLVGHPVRIGRIEARWWRWGPEFTLTDVRVMTDDGKFRPVRVAQTRLGIDLVASIRYRRLQPISLTVVGARITVERPAGGGIRLAGFATITGGAIPARDGLTAWFLAQEFARIEQSELLFRDLRTGSVIHLHGVAIDLRNVGDFHRLHVEGTLDDRNPGRLEVRALLTGPGAEPGAWQGEVYSRGRGISIVGLAGGLVEARDTVTGVADWELWGTWAAGRLRQMSGRGALSGFLTGNEAAAGLLPADVRLEFDAERNTDGGWEAAFDRVILRRGERTWPQTQMRLSLQWDEDNHLARVRLFAGYAALEDLWPAASAFVPVLSPMLQSAKPRGELLDFDLYFGPEAGSDGQSGFAYSGQMRGFGTRRAGNIPGISGLGGRFTGESNRGLVELDSKALQLDATGWFRQSLEVERLAGRFGWVVDGHGIWLRSPGWALATPHIRVEGRSDLLIPRGGGRPFLHLVADLRDGDGSHVSEYLPAAIMSDKVVGWLDRALVEGRVPNGSVLVHGWLGDFPFDDGNGRFEVRARVEDYVLAHNPGWPRIEAINADLWIRGRRLEVRADAGRVFSTRIDAATAVIPDLTARPAVLQVSGTTRGAGADGLRYLLESPLRDIFAPYLDQASIGGAVNLDLVLEVPLRRGLVVKVDGAVDFAGNSVRFGGWDTVLEQVAGRLKFTESSVSGERLRAQLWDSPLQLQVKSVRDGGRPSVQVDARGHMPVAALREELGLSMLTMARGEADYRARVSMRKDPVSGKDIPTLSVQSDLVGVGLEMPFPLGKTKDEPGPLDLALTLSREQRRTLRLQYGDLASLALAFRRGEAGFSPESGALVFGGDAYFPDAPGLHVTGRLQDVALAEWSTYLTGLAANGAVNSGGELALRDARVQVERLRIAGQVYPQSTVEVLPAESGWRVLLDGSGISGQVDVDTTDSRPHLDGAFSLLVLGREAEPRGEVPGSWSPDPRTIPGLRLHVDLLRWRDSELGTLELQAVPAPHGLDLERLVLDGGPIRADATGEWSVEESGSSSRINAVLDVTDTGSALERLGYGVGVEGGGGIAEMDLMWSGGPEAFDLSRVDGRLFLQLGKGILVDVKPGVGRLFGLLSVQALSRRLALDFRDLVQEGFVFDRIQGRFTLDGGDAYTNDFLVAGPAARIDLAGRIGLLAEDYDQIVTVTPSVGGSLSVAGAIAGGPAGAAAVLLLQEVFKPQLEQATRVQYSLTGSWEDPVMEKIQVLREDDDDRGDFGLRGDHN